jgi:hypothetical protein
MKKSDGGSDTDRMRKEKSLSTQSATEYVQMFEAKEDGERSLKLQISGVEST